MALKRKIKDTFKKKSTHSSLDRLELEPVVSLSNVSATPTTQCTIKWGERRKSKSVVDGKRKEKMSETSTRLTLNQASPSETPSWKRSGSKDRQPTKKRKVTTQDSTEYILISPSPPSSPATTVSTVLGTVPEADQDWYVLCTLTVQLTASHSFHRCTQMSPSHLLILRLT